MVFGWSIILPFCIFLFLRLALWPFSHTPSVVYVLPLTNHLDPYPVWSLVWVHLSLARPLFWSPEHLPKYQSIGLSILMLISLYNKIYIASSYEYSTKQLETMWNLPSFGRELFLERCLLVHVFSSLLLLSLLLPSVFSALVSGTSQLSPVKR